MHSRSQRCAGSRCTRSCQYIEISKPGTSTGGINGPIDDVLFPIQHGMLFYPGFDVLPPYVVFRTGKVDAERFAQIRRELGERLDTLGTTPPIPYRRQNHGEYDIPALTLKDDIATGQTGYAGHIG